MHILRLSPDSLQLIFESFSTAFVMQTLRKVCRQWKAAAFSARRFALRNEYASPYQLTGVMGILQLYQKLVALQLNGFRSRDPAVSATISATLQRLTLQHTQLRELAFVGCDVSEPEPLSLDLPVLQLLDLSECRRASLPQLTPRCLQSLTALNLSRTHISDFEISKLPPIPGLRVLVLNNMKNLRNFTLTAPKLGYLDLSHSPLIDQALDHILDSSPELHTLLIDSCKGLRHPSFKAKKLEYLSVRGLKRLPTLAGLRATCPRLRVLRVGLTTIHDPDLVELFAAPTLADAHPPFPLEALQLTSIQSTGIGLTSLRCVEISFSAVEDHVVSALCLNSPLLEELLLEYCVNLRRPHIAGARLEVVHVARTDIDDMVIQGILDGCPRLRRLHASRCGAVAGATLVHPELRFIDVSSTGVSGRQLEEAGAGCPQLEQIHAANCKRIVDMHLISTGLRICVLGDCIKMENVALQCPALEVLDLGNGAQLANLSLSGCPNLREVNLYNCDRFARAVPAGAVLANERRRYDPVLPHPRLLYPRVAVPGSQVSHNLVCIPSSWIPAQASAEDEPESARV